LDSDGNGLLQSTDFASTLSGITALADPDIAFDITGSTGAATITTGAGNDTVAPGHADDVITTGKGDDQITVITDADGTMAFGAGTDTLIANHANADITGSTITGLEAISLPLSGAVLDITEAQLDAFNDVANFTVTGLSGSTQTLLVAADGGVSAEDYSSIVYTDVALTHNVDEVADVIKTGTGTDTFIIASAHGTGVINLDAGGGSAVDVLDINTSQAVVLDAGTLTGFETLELDATGVTSNLTLDSTQFNSFTTITAQATDVVKITEMDSATVTGSAALDTFTFSTTDDDAVIKNFRTAGADKIDLGRIVTKAVYTEQANGTFATGTYGFVTFKGDVTTASATMDAAAMSHAHGPVGGIFNDLVGDNTAYLMFKANVSNTSSDAYIYYATVNEDGDAFSAVDLIATVKDVGSFTTPAQATANFRVTES